MEKKMKQEKPEIDYDSLSIPTDYEDTIKFMEVLGKNNEDYDSN